MTKRNLIKSEPGVIMADHYYDEVERLMTDPVIVEMVHELPRGFKIDQPTRWDFTMTANQVYAQRCADRGHKAANESIGGVRWTIIALLKKREEADYGQH
jgi:hypothetical protein